MQFGSEEVQVGIWFAQVNEPQAFRAGHVPGGGEAICKFLAICLINLGGLRGAGAKHVRDALRLNLRIKVTRRVHWWRKRKARCLLHTQKGGEATKNRAKKQKRKTKGW